MNQRTLGKSFTFEGKGLHTGKYAHMELCPAAPDTGIVFERTDKGGARVEALASNVISTHRSTEIGRGKARVRTIEHVLSFLTGMGVDNALIKIDSAEVPILDGSARLYAEAIGTQDIIEQEGFPRKWIELDSPVELRNARTGGFVRIEPAPSLSYECTIDFDSRVLGVQTVGWDFSKDFSVGIAPCRTFCFFHDIARMALMGLVRGGDVNNAIVVVEKPVRKASLRRIAKVFGQPLLDVTENGYLSNLNLRFDDECGRHKLLDLIGDLRLCGGFLKAKVTAYKPGHRLNTLTAKLIVK